jgi:hypothetical protein
MKTIWAVSLVTLSVCLVSFAQSSSPPRKPNVEFHRVSDPFIGTWELTGDTKPSPFGPGGQKFASKEQLEWMPGEFFMVVHSYEDGKLSGLTIIGYDEREKVLTHTTFSTSGEVDVLKGTVEGDTVTWTQNTEVDGKPVKLRMKTKQVSPTLYTFTMELAPNNDDWAVVSEGKGMKIQ